MSTRERTPIVVPATVLTGLEYVRASGLTNMLDRPRVMQIALVAGYDATVRLRRMGPRAPRPVRARHRLRVCGGG